MTATTTATIVSKTFKPTAEQLVEILAKHKLWLRGEEGGERADLSSADLSSADLRSADLSSADLRYANLRYANLSYANLRYANLSSADLHYADLSSANLRSADLSSADLSSADLRYANLSSANLRSANLSSANLRSADLSSADLHYADLSSANLRSADLSSANLRSADLSSARLNYVIGNACEVKSLQCGTYVVSYTATHMQIGCQTHELAQWFEFDARQIDRMDCQATTWWAVWKPILQAIIAVSPAVPIVLEDTETAAA